MLAKILHYGGMCLDAKPGVLERAFHIDFLKKRQRNPQNVP